MTTATIHDRLIEAGALFLIVFTPFAFGTVEPWSEAVAEIVILGMVVTWLIGSLRNWELRVELPAGWLANAANVRALVTTRPPVSARPLIS